MFNVVHWFRGFQNPIPHPLEVLVQLRNYIANEQWIAAASLNHDFVSYSCWSPRILLGHTLAPIIFPQDFGSKIRFSYTRV